jgi:hypothetical protein
MTNSWQRLIDNEITLTEYDYLTQVVEELEPTYNYSVMQDVFIRSIGISPVNVRGSVYFHGKRFRKVRLRDGTICMSCKSLIDDSGGGE